jgi:hypothetical protein
MSLADDLRLDGSFKGRVFGLWLWRSRRRLYSVKGKSMNIDILCLLCFQNDDL